MFSTRLDALLKAAAISRAELARHIGSSPDEVTAYISKGRMPTTARIDAIADALGVDVAELFCDHSPVRPPRFVGNVLRIALLMERADARERSSSRRALTALRAIFSK